MSRTTDLFKSGMRLTQPHILFVTEKLTFREVQSPQEFRIGEVAEVICDVISSPVPVVAWYYQNMEITEEHYSKWTTGAPIILCV